MDSINIWVGSRHIATRGLLGALAALPAFAAAQDVAELRDLIFEPVPLATALAAPRPIGPRPASDFDALSNELADRLADLERLERGDAPGPQIIEALAYLAVAYQGLDRHDDALETLDDAVDLTRDGGGRNNLEQIPLLEQMIPSYLAQNDIDSIDDTEERIYELKDRNFNAASRDMYYATINLADWNTTAYYWENYGAGNRTLKRQRGVIPRVQRCIRLPGTTPSDGAAGCEGNPIFTGEIKDVFDQDVNDARLRKIDRLYANYQEALFDGGNVQLDVVIDIAKRIARLAFATKQEMDFERDNYRYDPNYDGSREQALRNSPARLDESYLTGERALKYAIDFPSRVADFRPEALAASLLDLGDWHLAYGKAAAAGSAYSQAYDVLMEAGFSSENIDRGLATDLPTQVPVFATHLYTRRSTGVDGDAELPPRGYIDVSYTVDRLGNARGVRFLGGSSDSATAIERLLDLQLKSMKFRPMLEGGEIESPGLVEARYYYTY
jgi:hypothetical protein